MASLADLLDPDQWIRSGKSLLDFPWPEGNNEREAVKLILSRRPLLNAHYERWSKKVMEAGGPRVTTIDFRVWRPIWFVAAWM